MSVSLEKASSAELLRRQCRPFSVGIIDRHHVQRLHMIGAWGGVFRQRLLSRNYLRGCCRVFTGAFKDFETAVYCFGDGSQVETRTPAAITTSFFERKPALDSRSFYILGASLAAPLLSQPLCMCCLLGSALLRHLTWRKRDLLSLPQVSCWENLSRLSLQPKLNRGCGGLAQCAVVMAM